VRYLLLATLVLAITALPAQAQQQAPQPTPQEQQQQAPQPTPQEVDPQDYSEVVHGDPSLGLIALTFDAGTEGGGSAPEVLQILRDRGLHVTFFLSGHWVDHNPELAEQIVTDGHEVANHSYDHPDLTHLSDDQIVWELDYTDQVVSDVMGTHTRPYFRPPFGARNRHVLDAAAASGFRSIYWSIDSGDWLPRATPGAVVDKILRYAQPGDIVVEHVGSDATAAALPTVLDGLAERGLQVATVSQVLGLVPFK
jgi:peptidoglycan/xylan/chitin deacetylase (PgdA/CDA1 family)